MIMYILLEVFIIIVIPITSALIDCEEEWTVWEKIKYVLLFYSGNCDFLSSYFNFLYSIVNC